MTRRRRFDPVIEGHLAEIRRLEAMRKAMRAELGSRRPAKDQETAVRDAARHTLPGRLHEARKTMRRLRGGMSVDDLIVDAATPSMLENHLRFLTCKQTASRLGVTVRSVRAWIRRGVIVAARRGREWHIDPSSIARLERVARGEE